MYLQELKGPNKQWTPFIFFASERSRIDMHPASNLREVTVNFRKLARIYHSDKWGKKKVDEKFKTISYAYEDFKISNTSIGKF